MTADRAGERRTPHGFELTPEEHRLLRGAPPARALRWCASAIGRRAKIVRVVPLAGGTSSAVHAVDVEDDRMHRLVLRRFVRADWLEEEPDLAQHEAAALELVRDCAVPTPRLVAVDADGEAAGAPAVLMTRLEGSIEWDPADLDGYLRRLAGVLPEIHAVGVPIGTLILAYDPYELETREPPSWSTRPEMWRRAFEIYDGPPPAHERRFIHRDYHPGNVLWADGAVSGVVDWVNASVGSPAADVGHCRVNLAGALGIEAADRFLDLYGRDEYHPYWDVVAALGGADLEEWTPADERFLAHAIAEF